jgi:hypothetical protein
MGKKERPIPLPCSINATMTLNQRQAKDDQLRNHTGKQGTMTILLLYYQPQSLSSSIASCLNMYRKLTTKGQDNQSS